MQETLGGGLGNIIKSARSAARKFYAGSSRAAKGEGKGVPFFKGTPWFLVQFLLELKPNCHLDLRSLKTLNLKPSRPVLVYFSF